MGMDRQREEAGVEGRGNTANPHKVILMSMACVGKTVCVDLCNKLECMSVRTHQIASNRKCSSEWIKHHDSNSSFSE